MRRQVVAVGVLAAAFVALSAAAGLGLLDRLDRDVAAAFATIWVPQLRAPFLLIAFIGGSEATALTAAAIAAWLYQHGFAREAWVALSLPLAVGVEVLYKRLVSHPGPPRSLQHGDAPTLTDLLPGPIIVPNSFPSGHMVRTTLVYGLLAFVVVRLSGSARTGTLVTVTTVLALSAMAFDRLYLEVHWLSDVAGGLLLGGLFLAVSTLWLDRGVPTT